MPTYPGAPFLLLSIRAEDSAADEEYAAMMRFSGLDEVALRRIRLDRESVAGLDLADWSGLILGGGAYNVTDPRSDKSEDQLRVEAELADLLRTVVDRDFPFLGCCYGIGTLGTLIGAVVDRTYSEPISAVPVTLTEAGRDDPLLEDLPAEFEAFVGHKEAICTLPDEAVLLASSPDCPVQAFRLGRNVYATQFHPELDVPGICTRIDVYRNHGYFAPGSGEKLKAAMQLTRVVHPPSILRTFVRRYG
jgi:GMP synthase (glutamine-hydrolysing)